MSIQTIGALPVEIGHVMGPCLKEMSPNDRWLPCDGRLVSVLKYWDLFCAIGYRFGKGHNGLYFGVPDCTATDEVLRYLFPNPLARPVDAARNVFYYIKAK